MDDHKLFLQERKKRIKDYHQNNKFKELGKKFLISTLEEQYSYNFSWMGLPIIQYPQDMAALQEIIWETRPDMIIETGIARGGSLIFYASMLELLGNNGIVVGIDIDIRTHNRKRIVEHPLSHRIRLIESSSVEKKTLDAVKPFAEGRSRVMVSLDSNHTRKHVAAELGMYAPLVSMDCYCVVFDTVIEDMPEGSYPDRSWGKGNNPRTAVNEFLQTNKNFVIDEEIESKLMITAAPGGYLKRIK